MGTGRVTFAGVTNRFAKGKKVEGRSGRSSVGMSVVGLVVAGASLADGGRRGDYQASGLHAFGPDQAVGQFADGIGLSTEEDHLQASPGIEVDMRSGHDTSQVVML